MLSSSSTLSSTLFEKLVAHQQQLKEESAAAERLAEELKSLCAKSALWLSDVNWRNDVADTSSLDEPWFDSVIPISPPAESEPHLEPFSETFLPSSNQHGEQRKSLAAGTTGKRSVTRERVMDQLVPGPVSRRSRAVPGREIAVANAPLSSRSSSHSTVGHNSSLRSWAPPTPRKTLQQRLTITSALPPRGLFADAEQLAKNLEDLVVADAEDTVEAIYSDGGVCQKVVTHPAFRTTAFRIVVLNCLWMAFEIDMKTSNVLYAAHPVFPIFANLFCLCFVCEIAARALALRNKNMILLQFDLLFDAFLALVSASEAWILPILIVITGGATDAESISISIVVKILRLLGVLRLGRVLRELPDLLVMLRGILAALRGVAVTMMLLTMTIYFAAVIFRVLLEGTDLGKEHFASVPNAMGTLLIEATLSGSRGAVLLRASYIENGIYSAMMLAFVFLTNILMMGMIAGLLVQTVRAVAESETEQHSLRTAQSLLNQLWDVALDHDDGDGSIDKHELMDILASDETQALLQQIGVDVEGLLNVSGFIIEQHHGKLSKTQFKRMILDLRGNKVAKVKDHVETRKFLTNQLKQVHGLEKLVPVASRLPSIS
eukprot:TRINITY_DN37254_c0_g1_i1.p1 TRINITY_DN37254_c0_g1~~TRINITY_DN37254_c0_g1_i1.p1  ORF type:complete len:604 (-),score=75.71 TRINITY_DN37254_c0_g1_i1:118-1929(-)